jgi:hypothetical protein
MNDLEIICDADPLLLFLELLEHALNACEGFRKELFGLGRLAPELIRLEVDDSSAAAGKLTVRLYPSDGLLRFASTLRAGNVNLEAV